MEDRLGLKKRKRRGPGLEDLNLVGVEDRKNRVDQLTNEMEGLFRYFAEVTVPLDAPLPTKLEGAVRVLMEGSHLTLSELVALVLQRVAAAETPSAAVKTAVLTVGHRVCYGLPHPDVDLLEDTSRNALWCWEATDVKLLPKPVRALVRVHRTCRKKIHDRVAALSALIDALLKLEGDPKFENDVVRASDRLGKVLAEADIRLLVADMLQRLTTPSSDSTLVQGEKSLTKELDKNIKQVEREKKRTEIELQKERRQHEKEQKWLQDEAEKEEKRREKEESEMRKLARKKQEEAEKEQRRRDKEEAELKKQRAVKKQASLMESFLKKSKVESPCQNSNKATTPDLLPNPNGDMPSAATQSMDYSLSSRDDSEIESIDGIRKSHLTSWHHLGRSNREQHWSIRRKPKVELIKEIKLKAAKESPWDDELAAENLVSGWGGQNSYERTHIDGGDTSSSGVKVCKRKLQLLQFDKSNRPAFYGIWPNKSSVVGPRHPLRKDPDLDYDVDSDEEWEEEDPGESISDCDKDEEEESLDQGCSKAAEDEDEDGFFVPDGYLSENEGVQVDRMEMDAATSEIRVLPSFEDDDKSEEFQALLSQQKYLNNLTESALRKNKPLIILNLVHEKLPLLASEGLTGTLKLEKLCLQALSIRALSGESLLPIAVCNNQAEDQDVSVCNSSCHTPPETTSIIVQDLDMHTFKFPAASKTQLRRKVREISKYVDNRWQVKKEILKEVGLPAGTGTPSPDKGGLVSSFFKKRCLPAVDKSGDLGADDPAPKSSDTDIVQQQE